MRYVLILVRFEGDACFSTHLKKIIYDIDKL